LFVAGQKNIGLKISTDKFSSLDFRPIRFFGPLFQPIRFLGPALSANPVFRARAFDQSGFLRWEFI
jgi:hypothetical protein